MMNHIKMPLSQGTLNPRVMPLLARLACSK
jgi:hypothetical protein